MHFHPLSHIFQLRSTSSQYMKLSTSSKVPASSNALRRISAAAPEHHVVSPVAPSTAFGCSLGVCLASQMPIRASDSARARRCSRQPDLISVSGFSRKRKSPLPCLDKRFIPLAKPLLRRERKQ